MNKTLLLLITLFVISCQGQDCKLLKEEFTTYSEALKTISNTSFDFKDSTDTSSSSWIKDANYFSCDTQYGYLVLKTSSKKYIFKRVPLQIWNEFKKANSFGKYYNQKIRNQYQFILSE